MHIVLLNLKENYKTVLCNSDFIKNMLYILRKNSNTTKY